MYTVSESDGQVEVCVNLTSVAGDIGDKMILVDVAIGEGPNDAVAASKLI